MLPLDQSLHDEYRRAIRDARAKQGATVPKGTKFTEEHKANMRAAFAASPHHRSKNQRGSANAGFKGGFVDKAGYRLIRIGDKDVPEHRHVMAQMIGRPLLAHETVHHKNGDRQDNDISNLELWSSRQPKGQRVEDKIHWAKEMLALYGELIGPGGAIQYCSGYSPEEHF